MIQTIFCKPDGEMLSSGLRRFKREDNTGIRHPMYSEQGQREITGGRCRFIRRVDCHFYSPNKYLFSYLLKSQAAIEDT